MRIRNSLEGYHFYEGLVTPDYSAGFEESLFNTQAHRAVQHPNGWHSFYILHEPKKKISGAIHFHISDGLARSPYRAPFGSLEFDPSVPARIIAEFLQFLEEQLIKHHVSSIEVKSYPDSYQQANASLLQTCLLSLNYEIVSDEIGSVIDIGEKDIHTLFSRSREYLLKKGNHEGLSFKQIDLHKLKDVYYFIDQCQREKGYVLSMTFDQLQKTANVVPGHVKIFGVFQENRLAAASISIQIRKEILYDFYHDHDPAFNHISPVGTLIAGLYGYCFDHGIHLLDLGTSALHGEPNTGLLQFKRSLGARQTPKRTFFKSLR